MMTDWYLKIANKEVGPLSSQQLKAMAKKGQLGPEDLIRQGGGGPWIAAGRVKGLLSLAASGASDSTVTPLPTAKALEDTVEVTKNAIQAETTTTVGSIAHKPKPATPKAATPLASPPQSGNMPSAESVVLSGLPVARPVPGTPIGPADPRLGSPIPTGNAPSIPVGISITPAVASPTHARTGGTAIAAAPTASSSASETIAPAEAKRKRQRQQKALFTGLLGTLVVLAGVAVIVVVSTSGSKPAKPTAARKSDAPPPSVAMESEKPAKAEDGDVLDSLKGIEASVLKAAPADGSKRGDGWVDAQKQTATFGTVKVKVKAVEAGKARFTRLTEKCLAIHLELSNAHETKLRQYTPWRRQPGISLVDEFDNHYDLRAAKQTRGGSIYPGKSLEETIFFRPPVAKAKSLRLQLPAAAFDEEGSVRFEIPVSMIQEVEAISGTSASSDAQTRSAPGKEEGAEGMPQDSAPPQREEPRISRAIEESKPGQKPAAEPAKPTAKKASDLSSLQKEIKKLGGDEMEEEEDVADFESDPEAQKKIDAMRQQATPETEKKKTRRSRGG